MANAWDRRPNESQRQYARFLSFLRLDPTIRTVKRAAESKGASVNTYTRNAFEQEWTKRAAAYDAHQGEKSLQMAEAMYTQEAVSLVTAAAKHTSNVSERLVALQTMLDRLISEAHSRGDTDIKYLMELVSAQDKIDLLARRTLKMPTKFMPATPATSDVLGSDEAFVIGGDDGE